MYPWIPDTFFKEDSQECVPLNTGRLLKVNQKIFKGDKMESKGTNVWEEQSTLFIYKKLNEFGHYLILWRWIWLGFYMEIYSLYYMFLLNFLMLLTVFMDFFKLVGSLTSQGKYIYINQVVILFCLLVNKFLTYLILQINDFLP